MYSCAVWIQNVRQLFLLMNSQLQHLENCSATHLNLYTKVLTFLTMNQFSNIATQLKKGGVSLTHESRTIKCSFIN